jgi:VIT1/CCC1 family predicted Fe2+/Mn2+ transporter
MNRKSKQLEEENVENKESKANNAETEVRFGNGISSGVVSAAGALSGLGIAVGVPMVVLPFTAAMGQAAVAAIIITALIMGFIVCLISVVFGLVMPRRVGGPWGNPQSWAALSEKWHRWEREHHRQRGRRGGRDDGDD